MTPPLDAPAKGTRPRNRRELIVAAATELFYRRGYANVSMSDIADAINIGASALYRHFPGKSHILAAAIRAGLSQYDDILSTVAWSGDDIAEHRAAVLRRLSECAIDNRAPGVLWQRDVRNLDDELQKVLRSELRDTTRRFAALIKGARPELDDADTDLLAWCCFGLLVSIGFHSLAVPRQQFVQLVVSLIDAVISVPVTTVPSERLGAVGELVEGSRREKLLSVAIELFAEHGFGAVGVDDIAAAAGIAGPSVYAHFPSKMAILTAAIERASDQVTQDAADILARPADPERKLILLVDSYITLAIRDRALFRILISELAQLPPYDREIAIGAQVHYLDAWADLINRFSGEPLVPARIRAQAVLLVVSDAVQTPHLRTLTGFDSRLRDISRALLGVNP